MDKQGKWLLCPVCGGKTRVWIREDTVLRNFLLFCPKCRQERLIDLDRFGLTLLAEPAKASLLRRGNGHEPGMV